MLSGGDRAERPTGWVAWLGGALAAWRATEPDPPLVWSPPRGLTELSVLLEQVLAASSGAVLPPIRRDVGGYSLVTAREWCARAGLAPDVGALAVLLVSEARPIGEYPQYAWAIAEAVVNAAHAIQRKDEPLEDALVRRIVGERGAPAWRITDGRFGAQGGRWASTRQQPTRRHVRCAELVLQRARAGEPQILAHGATQWTDQDTQHLIHAAALKAGDATKAERNPDPEKLMRRRYMSGARWVGPLVDALGTTVIDPWRLTLLAPAGVDEGQAMVMLADGRRRWHRLA